MPTSPYDRRAKAREADRQRALMGETLEAFHARENAKPPTLAEIYARNHVNRERCPWTIDLEELTARTPRRSPRSGTG